MAHRGKRGRIVLVSILGVVVAVFAAAVISPWPSAMLIRWVFERGADGTVAEMTPFVPKNGVESDKGIEVGDGQTIDVFRPTGSTEALPTVVWIHGGAWISGQPANVDPYLQMIAVEGYTGIALSYTIAPEATYPTAVTQLNDALAYIVENADALGVDPNRIVLAGDSAGAQFASQLAAMVTNPIYADEVGIAPALTKDQLAAVILNCGIYDLDAVSSYTGIGGWGFKVALWAYTGDRNWSDSPGGGQMSTIRAITEDFPTTWISGGNGDPLTATQSKPFAEKLEKLGVDVSPVFYADDHEPKLPHEYQFHLDFGDAQAALVSTLDFLDRVVGD